MSSVDLSLQCSQTKEGAQICPIQLRLYLMVSLFQCASKLSSQYSGGRTYFPVDIRKGLVVSCDPDSYLSVLQAPATIYQFPVGVYQICLGISMHTKLIRRGSSYEYQSTKIIPFEKSYRILESNETHMGIESVVFPINDRPQCSSRMTITLY